MKTLKLLISFFLFVILFSGCSLFDSGSGRSSGGGGGNENTNTNTNTNNNGLPSTPICSSGEWTATGQAIDCVACPSASSPNAGSTSCICNSTADYFDASQDACLPTPCTGNTWPFQGNCTPCPTGSTVDVNNTGCTCSVGAFDSGMNQCYNILTLIPTMSNNDYTCTAGGTVTIQAKLNGTTDITNSASWSILGGSSSFISATATKGKYNCLVAGLGQIEVSSSGNAIYANIYVSPAGGCSSPNLQSYTKLFGPIKKTCFKGFCGATDQSASTFSANPASSPIIGSCDFDNTVPCYECQAAGTATVTVSFAGNTQASLAMTCYGSVSMNSTGPASGRVFYDKGSYSNGWRYMEAISVPGMSGWSNLIMNAVGTTGTAIGTGQANTTAIINQAGHVTSAAKACDTYSNIVAGTTYSDWFLPSKDELTQMFFSVGMFFGPGTKYWSSSEYNAYYAWYVSESLGASHAAASFGSSHNKSDLHNVICVRTF